MCGSGGVGKTTTAAAMAVQAASEIGGRVLVLTVDPARRLADALGVGAIGNEARLVPPEAFAASGVEPRGELWAAMLDTKAGWDELIRRHAPNAAVRASVLANPLYQNITGRFVHSHDYLAMDQLHELHASGRFDLIIVDTPPSRNALDVLDAPGRMKEFFGSRLLKWLTLPYRSRLFTAASKPFYQVADRVLGSRFLQDIAEFFILFQAMEPGFVAHAREVEQVLVDPRTTFVVVSTLEAAPTHEASYLARALRAATCTSARSSPTACCRRASRRRRSATSARKLAALDSDTVRARRGRARRPTRSRRRRAARRRRRSSTTRRWSPHVRRSDAPSWRRWRRCWSRSRCWRATPMTSPTCSRSPSTSTHERVRGDESLPAGFRPAHRGARHRPVRSARSGPASPWVFDGSVTSVGERGGTARARATWP